MVFATIFEEEIQLENMENKEVVENVDAQVEGVDNAVAANEGKGRDGYRHQCR